MIRIRKWYFDLVTDGGTAFIGYAALLRWGWFRVEHTSYLISSPGARPLEAMSWRRNRSPTKHKDVITWANPQLHLAGEWRARCPRVQKLLFRDGNGEVRWICHQPAAYAAVRIGNTELQGAGYVEELRLNIAPWQLPIDELMWGRFVSGNDSLVWIRWDGPQPLRLAYLNGQEVDDYKLELRDTRTLRNHALEPLLASAPFVGNALARRFGATLEHKMLSRGVVGQREGWVIHETVQWHTKQTA